MSVFHMVVEPWQIQHESQRAIRLAAGENIGRKVILDGIDTLPLNNSILEHSINFQKIFLTLSAHTL